MAHTKWRSMDAKFTDAIYFIALNDSPQDGRNVDLIRDYITVALAVEVFYRPRTKEEQEEARELVVEDICTVRYQEGLT